MPMYRWCYARRAARPCVAEMEATTRQAVITRLRAQRIPTHRREILRFCIRCGAERRQVNITTQVSNQSAHPVHEA